MSGKLLKFLLLGIAAVFFALGRWYTNSKASRFMKQLLKSLEESPSFANDVANDHLNQYAKTKNQSQTTLQKRLDFIKVNQMLNEKFQVLGKYPLAKDGVLLVTMCHNVEQGERKGSEVIKKFALNFVIKHAENDEIEICSDYYTALMDRILRQDFAKFLIEKV
jgi:hypothetical protein